MKKLAVNAKNVYLHGMSTIVVKMSLKYERPAFGMFWRKILGVPPFEMNLFWSFFRFSTKFGVRNEPDLVVRGAMFSIGVSMIGAMEDFLRKMSIRSLFCLKLGKWFWNVPNNKYGPFFVNYLGDPWKAVPWGTLMSPNSANEFKIGCLLVNSSSWTLTGKCRILPSSSSTVT